MLKRLPGMLASFVQDLGAMIWDALKSLIGGLFKKPLMCIKEGIGIIVEALRVLVQPAGKMSPAQKGDAILKLFGSLVSVLVLDFGLTGALTTLLTSVGLAWAAPSIASFLAAVVSALAGAMVAWLLDQLDLFSMKAELRLARIQEIFDARIADVRASLRNFEVAATEALKAQRLHFEELRASLNDALDRQDLLQFNAALDSLAESFQVDIPYDNPESFAAYVREHERIVIA